MVKFEAGHKKVGGRQKGSLNKVNAKLAEVQQKVLEALDTLDVQNLLYRIAEKDPRGLVALLTKVLPNKVEVSGGTDTDGNTQPLTIQIRGFKDDTAGNKTN